MERLKAWIRLLDSKEISYTKAKQLIQDLGDPVNFVGKESPELDLIDYISSKAKIELQGCNLSDSYLHIPKYMEHFNIDYHTILDEDYPIQLSEIYQAPLLYFTRGNFDLQLLESAIAVVGTRKPSSYGKTMTSRICQCIAEQKYTIVSGLAYGIDTEAHRSALENNGNTVAVLASGVEKIYPEQNYALAEQIIENGFLISEYVPGSRMEIWHFPERNRIISALCKATVVIEGTKNSGAMLTAKHALEQNRDVFALPGDCNRPQAEGPNLLIKKGAIAITKPEDVVEYYELIYSDTKKKELRKLNDKEEKVYQTLQYSAQEVDFDTLLLTTQLSIGELSTILLTLELEGIIKSVAGKFAII